MHPENCSYEVFMYNLRKGCFLYVDLDSRSKTYGQIIYEQVKNLCGFLEISYICNGISYTNKKTVAKII